MATVALLVARGVAACLCVLPDMMIWDCFNQGVVLQHFCEREMVGLERSRKWNCFAKGRESSCYFIYVFLHHMSMFGYFCESLKQEETPVDECYQAHHCHSKLAGFGTQIFRKNRERSAKGPRKTQWAKSTSPHLPMAKFVILWWTPGIGNVFANGLFTSRPSEQEEGREKEGRKRKEERRRRGWGKEKKQRKYQKAKRKNSRKTLVSTKTWDSVFPQLIWIAATTTRAWPVHLVFPLFIRFLLVFFARGLGNAKFTEGFKQVVSSSVCENGLWFRKLCQLLCISLRLRSTEAHLKNQTLMMIPLSRQYRGNHLGQVPCVPRSLQNPSGKRAQDPRRWCAKTPLALLTPLGHHLSACQVNVLQQTVLW